MASFVFDKGTAYRECCWVYLALKGGNGDPIGGREMEKVGGGYLRQLCPIFFFFFKSQRLKQPPLSSWIVELKVAIMLSTPSVLSVRKSEVAQEVQGPGKPCFPFTSPSPPIKDYSFLLPQSQVLSSSFLNYLEI